MIEKTWVLCSDVKLFVLCGFVFRFQIMNRTGENQYAKAVAIQARNHVDAVFVWFMGRFLTGKLHWVDIMLRNRPARIMLKRPAQIL
jgi:hypothetical protein